MRFDEFRTKYRNWPLINISQMRGPLKFRRSLNNQLVRWSKEGRLARLKKGLYLLNEEDRQVRPSRVYIANQLYIPSYVSLTFALSFYGLIPERVEEVTSVSTKKTAVFDTAMGRFSYRTIMKKAFMGMRLFDDEAGLLCMMAEPEKAVADFLYLEYRTGMYKGGRSFAESYRFQNTKSLDASALRVYAQLFQDGRLLKIMDEFIKWKNNGERAS